MAGYINRVDHFEKKQNIRTYVYKKRQSVDCTQDFFTPLPRKPPASKTAPRVVAKPYLHPFPEALVVRQSFSKALKEARFVGKGNKLLHEIALSQEDVKNHLLYCSSHQHRRRERAGGSPDRAASHVDVCHTHHREIDWKEEKSNA